LHPNLAPTPVVHLATVLIRKPIYTQRVRAPATPQCPADIGQTMLLCFHKHPVSPLVIVVSAPRAVPCPTRRWSTAHRLNNEFRPLVPFDLHSKDAFN
jgi:hypothetical protein